MSSTPRGFRRTGPGRVRENVGFGYADFTVGLTIEHRPGRTVSDMDNVLFTALSGNTAPIHLDAHYSAATEWEKPLVCSIVTLALVGGMTVRATSGLTTGNLGFESIRFPHPVFVGDTLYAQTEILSRRLSRSRPAHGIVTCRTSSTNQHGDTVITYQRSFLVPADPGPIRAATDY
ncbi:MaoC family dehydratase [Streptomyces sp. NPDC047829]|uniref:MaoC family dehydratase n=1 Tax=Streptomyces sp. NPDC047829 TaxID=3154609 RepID=UPI00340C7F21